MRVCGPRLRVGAVDDRADGLHDALQRAADRVDAVHAVRGCVQARLGSALAALRRAACMATRMR